MRLKKPIKHWREIDTYSLSKKSGTCCDSSREDYFEKQAVYELMDK